MGWKSRLEDKLNGVDRGAIDRELAERARQNQERAARKARERAESGEVARLTRDHNRQGAWVNERYR